MPAAGQGRPYVDRLPISLRNDWPHSPAPTGRHPSSSSTTATSAMTAAGLPTPGLDRRPNNPVMWSSGRRAGGAPYRPAIGMPSGKMESETSYRRDFSPTGRLSILTRCSNSLILKLNLEIADTLFVVTPEIGPVQ